MCDFPDDCAMYLSHFLLMWSREPEPTEPNQKLSSVQFWFSQFFAQFGSQFLDFSDNQNRFGTGLNRTEQVII